MSSLRLYKTHGGYLGKLDMPKEEYQKVAGSSGSVNPQMVVVLDRSGSMGNHVQKIVNNVLPEVVDKLGYQKSQTVCVIAFASSTMMFNATSDELRQYRIGPSGCTYMSPAVKVLQKYIQQYNPDRLRILTFSDGDLHDQLDTINQASELASTIKNIQINSQAIRYMTGGQPDTRGLASILQLNNVTKCDLKDVLANSPVDYIVDEVVAQFKTDGLSNSTNLIANKSVILSNPWSSDSTTDKINVTDGENTIWFLQVPQSVKIENSDMDIPIVVEDALTSENFSYLMKESLDKFIDRLKILKVVNNQQSQDEIDKIMAYFKDLELFLESSETDVVKLLQNTSLRGRIEYFKRVVEKRQKSIFNTIAEIANDSRVGKLSSAQQAEYLRNVDITRLGKALARRAETHGLDFTGTVRKEVREMAANSQELYEIDDTSHSVSFYSQDTTVGGIKALLDIVNSGMIDSLEADDVIKMVNIVGIACSGTIGDYPDPMTWRVDEIYPNCYLSVSDMAMAHIQSGGAKLKPPGYPDKEITNVIPIFDDHRVYNFLRKHAPTILEYSASVGMRRVITGIPMTNSYTVCAGVWKMVELLSTDRSTLNIGTFYRLIETFNTCIGTYFDYVLPYLTIDNHEQGKSFFIANNGVTNMIHPLYKIIKEGKTHNMEHILRAIYSFEAAQMMKKEIRKNHGDHDFVKNTLNDLLGVDFDKFGTVTTPIFEPNPDQPQHHEEYTVNQQSLNKLSSTFYFADWVTLVPDLMYATTLDDPVAYIRGLPTIDKQFMATKFGVPDMDDFRLQTTVQALLFPTKDKRVNDELNEMYIQDVGHPSCTLLKDYIRKQYRDNYTSKLFKKKHEEQCLLLKNLVDNIVASDTVEEFIALLRDGTTYNNNVHRIENTCSHGYIQLKELLLTYNPTIPHQLEKLRIFLIGKVDDEVVWNNGNVLWIPLADFEAVYNKYGATDLWQTVKEEYMANKRYIYRGPMEGGKPNRHGHHNGKPSFWALGYLTLESMIANISHEEWVRYKEIHHNCCGISQMFSK